jgi:hypothetical protein
MEMQQQSNPSPTAKRLRQQQLQLVGQSGDKEGGNKRQQRFWPCPICNRSFSSFVLEDHVNKCLDNCSASPPSSASSSFPTGDSASTTSAGELSLAALGQGRDDVLVVGFDGASLAGQGNSPCMATGGDVNLRHCFQKTSSQWTVESIECSNLHKPEAGNLHREDGFIEPIYKLLLDQEQEVFSLVKEDSGENELRHRLDCKEEEHGIASLSGEGSWTGNVNRDGVDKQGMAEEGKLGYSSGLDRPPPGFKLYEKQVQSQARLSMFRKFSSAPFERKCSVAVLQPGYSTTLIRFDG